MVALHGLQQPHPDDFVFFFSRRHWTRWLPKQSGRTMNFAKAAAPCLVGKRPALHPHKRQTIHPAGQQVL